MITSSYISLVFQRNSWTLIAVPTSSVMLVYGILTECGNDCKYSMYFWIELKSATLDKIGGKYVSVVLIRFVECFFRIFMSQLLKIETV